MNETGRGIAIGLGLLTLAGLVCSGDDDNAGKWVFKALVIAFVAVIVIALTASVCKHAQESIEASKHERGLSPTPDKK